MSFMYTIHLIDKLYIYKTSRLIKFTLVPLVVEKLYANKKNYRIEKIS